MIIELVIVGSISLISGILASKSFTECAREKHGIGNLIPSSISTTVSMVVELMKEPEGWTSNESTILHKTGVKLIKAINVYLYLRNDDGTWVIVDLNDEEHKRLKSEYNTFFARQTSNREQQAAEAVARRILQRDGAVLGSASVQSAKNDSMGRIDLVSSRGHTVPTFGTYQGRPITSEQYLKIIRV